MAEVTWKVPRRAMNTKLLREHATTIASKAGVKVEVELESADTVTCFFTLPASDAGPAGTVEVSVYDLERDGVVLSVEEDAGDNDLRWDEACMFGEELAEVFEGALIDD